jgi:hypothetical protein
VLSTRSRANLSVEGALGGKPVALVRSLFVAVEGNINGVVLKLDLLIVVNRLGL